MQYEAKSFLLHPHQISNNIIKLIKYTCSLLFINSSCKFCNLLYLISTFNFINSAVAEFLNVCISSSSSSVILDSDSTVLGGTIPGSKNVVAQIENKTLIINIYYFYTINILLL